MTVMRYSVAVDRLRSVAETAAYWEREWRRDHKGFGMYPEDHLWRATHGYLDLLAVTKAAGSS
jgi:hypothetical protein